jgi:hypothetical protein
MCFYITLDDGSCFVGGDLAYVRVVGVGNLSNIRNRLRRWLGSTLPLQRVHFLLKQRESLTLLGSIELF